MWKAFVLIAVLDGSPLAAVAADDVDPQHHHHKIPEEAFAACKDLSEGDLCTVTIHDQQKEGVCKKAHEDERLVCMPPHHPPPPPQ